jgi:preprotein translocase subunit Sec63
MLRLLIYAVIAYVVWRWLTRVVAAPPRARPVPAPTMALDPYEVLGVTRDATLDEIRAAYQTKVQQYHPDKVASMGPELRDVAERRTKEINAAYEQLKRRA